MEMLNNYNALSERQSMLLFSLEIAMRTDRLDNEVTLLSYNYCMRV